MVEWSVTEDHICGFGERGTVTLALDGWRPGGNPPALGTRVDAAVAGAVRALRLPGGDAVLAGEQKAGAPRLSDGTLPPGTHEVAVDAGLETRVSFGGPATVETGSTGPWLRFPDTTAVVVGFREPPAPRETMTVPPTASGLATAVTAAARTHRTAGPERSHPGLRPPTPRVAFGDDAAADVSPSTDRPTMTVPDDPVSVLVAAPLAYYVGADLETADGEAALSADGFEYGFEPLPAFADGVAGLLRRLCALDARIRSIPCESGALDVEVERADRLRDADPIERLRAVVESADAPAERWPLATYVDEDVRNGRYLPYLLDHLSLVYPAEASKLDPQALLKRSLDEFYRGDTPTVEAVDPSLADSRFHAWRGEGTPVEAFTLLGTADSRFDDGFEIDVVCNDDEMRAEGTVADVYRRHMAGRSVDVRFHERLTTAELATLFEQRTDLVHYVGHCDVDGLVCPDGHLAAETLETCGTDAFVLNACGSYHEGYDLVRRGATVGAVTLTTVLDDQAVTVGTTLAELLAGGFAFARALSLARGEIMAGRDYVVVGDGTHRLRPPRGESAVFDLERAGDEFRVGYDATAPDAAGRRYRDPFDGRERVCGDTATATLDRTTVQELFERVTSPVRYGGELRWTDELARQLPEPEA